MAEQCSCGSRDCVRCSPCQHIYKHFLSDLKEEEFGFVEVQNLVASKHVAEVLDDGCNLDARPKNSQSESMTRSPFLAGSTSSSHLFPIDFVDSELPAVGVGKPERFRGGMPAVEGGKPVLYRWREAGQALHSYLSRASSNQTATELRGHGDNSSEHANANGSSLCSTCWSIDSLVGSSLSIGSATGSCMYSNLHSVDAAGTVSNSEKASSFSAVDAVYKSCDQLKVTSAEEDIWVCPEVHNTQEESGFFPLFDELRETLSRLTDDKERKKSGSANDRRKQRLEEMTKRRHLYNCDHLSSSDDEDLDGCYQKPHYNLHNYSSVKSELRSLKSTVPSQERATLPSLEFGEVTARRKSQTKGRSKVVSEALQLAGSVLGDSDTVASCNNFVYEQFINADGQFNLDEIDRFTSRGIGTQPSQELGEVRACWTSLTDPRSKLVTEALRLAGSSLADSDTAPSCDDDFCKPSNFSDMQLKPCDSDVDSLSTSTPDMSNCDDAEEHASACRGLSRPSFASIDHGSQVASGLGSDMLRLRPCLTFSISSDDSDSPLSLISSDDDNLILFYDESMNVAMRAAGVGNKSEETPACFVPCEPHRDVEVVGADSLTHAASDASISVEDSLWDFNVDNVETEADDEFECDCPVCLMNRDQIQDVWQTSETRDMLNTSAGDDTALFSFSIDEPSNNILSHGGLLESLFQDVVVQMLQIYPDLFTGQTPPPVSADEFNALKSFQVIISELGSHVACCICLCPFEEGEDAKCLPCRHSFHTMCIQVWLNKTGTCPVCRDVVMQSARLALS